MHKLFVSFAQGNTRFGRKCELFKGLHHKEKRKIVQQGGPCNKCLAKGHIAKHCAKVNFKCQHSECGGGHH